MAIFAVCRPFLLSLCFVFTSCAAPSFNQSSQLLQLCQICKCDRRNSAKLVNCSYAKLNDSDLASADLSDTHTLILSNTNLEHVPDLRASQLVTFDLSHNHISDLREIPDGAFRNLRRLRDLNMSHNRLSKISKEMLHGAKGLVNLDMSYNEISMTAADAFAGLTNLATLQLDHNQLEEVPTVFKNNNIDLRQSLQTINLRGNPIRELPEDPFGDLQYLHYLDLSRMKLEYVHPDAFKGLTTGLYELHLNSNKLQTLSVQTIQNLRYLTSLSLYDNPLACNCTLADLASYLEAQPDISIVDLDTTHCSVDGSPNILFISREISMFCTSFPMVEVIVGAVGLAVLITLVVIITYFYRKRHKSTGKHSLSDHANNSTLTVETSFQLTHVQTSAEDKTNTLEVCTRSEHFYSSIKSLQSPVYAYAQVPGGVSGPKTVEPVATYKNVSCPQAQQAANYYLVPSCK
ncbi:vasorin-like [Acanthaster planci]|uniref:Vasorin-like n=1 Tax=Acanthaster planci TaxID=133434 RepID=A0A8B7Z689_ACAPL|nr:vasorin-like [Acanthaster planci]